MKKKKSGGGANWMDTYGDLVTLLMCFFILMYSMSSVSEEKWAALVQSFNPDAIYTGSGDLIDAPGDVAPENPEDITEQQSQEALDELYVSMKEYVEAEGLSDNITLTKGNGYVFVSFDDAVFFAPNQYDILAGGQEILDAMAVSLSSASEYINEVRVLGHTASLSTTTPNEPLADRMLASNRATVVTVYLQEKDVVDPARLVSVGYGEWRPIGDETSPESMAQSRRVELIVSGFDIGSDAIDEIDKYYAMREGEDYTE